VESREAGNKVKRELTRQWWNKHMNMLLTLTLTKWGKEGGDKCLEADENANGGDGNRKGGRGDLL
jgi:hypothetical protein